MIQPGREQKSHSSTLTEEDAHSLSFSVVMPYNEDEFGCIKQRFTAALTMAASTSPRVRVLPCPQL